ncbi:competence/damage-inducible protein A [Anaerocolumna sedimenticola]|uniref:Putative competence-damage inducible protein n=1 Tax=Anaerocolumna sedimenticola TaxID=2696063 RepID=A0A6P1TLU2_9FIRM|nr:competence/damage-inducible protein A [Anaerocolumna sedimenticola]QHQ62190.1 competence/damage-inducible protein A [Anaerocolumna sedimenticola]
MIAEFISVGTEILLGNIVNTNANYLAVKCAELGISNFYQVSVGDNEDRLSQTLNMALSRSDIVILTGGLGPTKDDLTKEVTAKVLQRNLIEDARSKERIMKYFKDRKFDAIPENNWKQALIIEGSLVIDNHNGTAPGLIVKTDESNDVVSHMNPYNNKVIILLPGPPNELIPMFESDIIPFLRKLQPGILYSEMVKICGIGESKAEIMVQDLIEQQTNPTIATYAKNGEVHIRITAAADSEENGKLLVKPLVDELKRRFTTAIYTTDESENLEDVVVSMLAKHHIRLTTAESCTGGLIAGRIVNVPGASAVLGEGFITYSNEAKQKYLKVSAQTLMKYGAVSKETAAEMAQGAASVSESNASLAVTGIAGPDGGTEEKPVGLVYIGCTVNGKIRVKECRLKGNRQKIRDLTVIYALDLLRNAIMEEYGI